MLTIASFCAHQPFLFLFGRTGHRFWLLEDPQQKRFLQNWNPSVRPLPPHWEVVPSAQAKARRRQVDLCLAHNISDYIDFLSWGRPIVLVIHSTVAGRLLEERSTMDKQAYIDAYFELVSRSGGHVVFVSEHKRQDWQKPGTVIPLAANPEDYPEFCGDRAVLLRVANHLKERRELLDYAAHRRMTRGFPTTLIGVNPTIPEARPATNWQELKDAYQSHRAYVYSAVEGLEDGYNMASLEAMAAGMPIVSTPHATSPIEDGVHGYVSADHDQIRQHIGDLLANRDLALSLGAAAREKITRDFHVRDFERRFDDLFHQILKT
jgi:glycosyltransferase involved in cell wall biosynthesis